MDGIFHKCGHVDINDTWNKVNKYMDAVREAGFGVEGVAGSGHRLKFGHSINSLPEIIEKFGIVRSTSLFHALASRFYVT